MDQSEFDAKLPTMNFTPDAGITRTFVVDETATGADEVFDEWGGGEERGYMLLRSRYAETQPVLFRSVRPFLSRGATCVITTKPAEIDQSGNVVEGTMVCAPGALQDVSRRTLEVLAVREAEAREAVAKAGS